MTRRLLLALACTLALTGACGHAWAQARGDADPVSGDELTIKTASGVHAFRIEIARSDEERARGLMFRTELAPDAGMLFDFAAERPVGMWMRNTYVALDMLFIRADGRVATIARDTVPLSERTIESGVSVRYVLEVPAGTAKRIGVQPGDAVKHPAIR